MSTRVKIVPDAEPNADGEWITVDAEARPGAGWIETEAALSPFAPEGFHVVATGGTVRNH